MERIKEIKLLKDQSIEKLISKINKMCECETVLSVQIHDNTKPVSASVSIGKNINHRTLFDVFFQITNHRFRFENENDSHMIHFLTYYLQSMGVFVNDENKIYDFQRTGNKVMSLELESNLFSGTDLVIVYQHDINIDEVIDKLRRVYHTLHERSVYYIRMLFDVYTYFEDADNQKDLKDKWCINHIMRAVRELGYAIEPSHPLYFAYGTPTNAKIVLTDWYSNDKAKQIVKPFTILYDIPTDKAISLWHENLIKNMDELDLWGGDCKRPKNKEKLT